MQALPRHSVRGRRRSARCAGDRRSRMRAGKASRTPAQSLRTARSSASPYGVASTTEDCLYLNVYTPEKISNGQPHLLPVMFWIHGGGARRRRERRLRPDPAGVEGRRRRDDQLPAGRLGFLAHPALTAESAQRRVGQLRPDGPAGGAALGAAQHPALRRRCRQRHDLRRVGRRPEHALAARLAAGGRAVPQGDRRERRLLADAAVARRRGRPGHGVRDAAGLREPDGRLPARAVGLRRSSPPQTASIDGPEPRRLRDAD